MRQTRRECRARCQVLLTGQVAEAASAYRRNRVRKTEPVSGAEFLSGFHKTDRLIPVIKLTVHFGLEQWDGPLGIREMMNTQDPELLKYIPDYRINLMSPSTLSEEELHRFTTDFGLVMEYIRFSDDKFALDRITGEGDRYRNLDVNTANLINAATGDKLHIEEKEGHVDMRNAIDEMKQDSFMEGCEEGRKEGHTEGIEETRLTNIKSIMEKLAYTAKQAMALLNIPESDQEKYLSKL